MFRGAVLVIAILASPILSLPGQGGPTVAPGARLRITVGDSASSRRLVGTLVAQDSSAIRLKVPDLVKSAGAGALVTKVVSVPLTTITELEVSRPRSNGGKGALIGLGVGAVSGAIVGAAGGSCAQDQICIAPRGSEPLIGAVIFGGAGALLGALVGSTVHSDRWESVSLSRAKVTLAPRGAGLALSLAF
jgi:hypothetical protein